MVLSDNMRGAHAELRVFGLKKTKKSKIKRNYWQQMPKLRAKEKQLPWRGGRHNTQLVPWHGAHGCHCHTGFPPLLVGDRAALASLERNRPKHPWGGWESQPWSWDQAGTWPLSLWPHRVPTSCGAVAEILPHGGRAGGSDPVGHCPSSKCKRWKLC